MTLRSSHGYVYWAVAVVLLSQIGPVVLELRGPHNNGPISCLSWQTIWDSTSLDVTEANITRHRASIGWPRKE
jgi:hypothetical protein